MVCKEKPKWLSAEVGVPDGVGGMHLFFFLPLFDHDPSKNKTIILNNFCTAKGVTSSLPLAKIPIKHGSFRWIGPLIGSLPINFLLKKSNYYYEFVLIIDIECQNVRVPR